MKTSDLGWTWEELELPLNRDSVFIVQVFIHVCSRIGRGKLQ